MVPPVVTKSTRSLPPGPFTVSRLDKSIAPPVVALMVRTLALNGFCVEIIVCSDARFSELPVPSASRIVPLLKPVMV